MTIRRWILVAALVASATIRAAAQQTTAPSKTASLAFNDIGALIASLPTADPPVLNESQAVWLAEMPLACLDHPQAAPSTRGYLWEANYRPPDDYQKALAFYGCFDWHSSVNSTWTLVKLLKGYPNLSIGGLIRERLRKHLDKSNLTGELTYLKGAGEFERPYGYAWILKLAAELSDWKDPDGQTWAANISPLAEWASAEMAEFFKSMPQPNRGGVHPNSSFAMYLMMDYVDLMNDETLRSAIMETTRRFYEGDKNCSTKNEPAGSDFLSPCLTEAALMGRLMPRDAFLLWLNTFLPPMNSADFKPLTEPVETAGVSRPEQLAGKSHLIGLAFQRGLMMNRVAELLPDGDLRAAALRRLAAIHGVKGMQAMYDAGYYGSHWLGTYAVYYMLSK